MPHKSLSCSALPASRAGALKCNAFNELCSASNSALEALEALASLRADIKEDSAHWQGPGLSFTLLKKHCLQLGVQAHKCTRLLAMISGKDDTALQNILAGQLQALDRLLDDHPQPENKALFRRLAAGWQGAAGGYVQQPSCPEIRLDQNKIYPAFIIERAAGWHFFHAAGLFPRINHALQQLDSNSWESLTAVSVKIQQLIMASPLPADMQDGLEHEVQVLFFPEVTPNLALIPQVHSEDGSRSSFAGLFPVLRPIDWRKAGKTEHAYKQVLASLYTPQCLAYMEARGLRHERSRLSVLCIPENAILAASCSNRQASATTNTDPHAAFAAVRTGKNQPQLAGGPNRLLESCSGSAGIAAGKVRIICNLADTESAPKSSSRSEMVSRWQGKYDAGTQEILRRGFSAANTDSALTWNWSQRTVAVVSQASMDWVVLLPRIVALIVEERVAEDCPHPLLYLAREFGLPVIYGRAASSFCDGMPVTVDAAHGAIYAGIIESLVQNASLRPRGTADSPVEKTLATLCQLTGADHAPGCKLPPLSTASATNCATMLDLILWCRFRAVQTLLDHSSPNGILRLTPGFRFFTYDINGLSSENIKNEQHLSIDTLIDTLTAPLLQPLWQGMAQEVELKAGRIGALDPSHLKNSVLLGSKCCTLQFVHADFFLYLRTEVDRQGQNFRLVLLLEDGRIDGADRLPLLASRLASHGLKVQVSGRSLRAISTGTKHPRFEHDLHFLGALTIQALA